LFLNTRNAHLTAHKKRQSKMQNLPLKYTPSYLYNNLSSNGENTAFVHNSEVFLINDVSLGEKEPKLKKVSTRDASPVYQAKWCKSNGKIFLTLGLKNGVQVQKNVIQL
jgi:hypothetical protein